MARSCCARVRCYLLPSSILEKRDIAHGRLGNGRATRHPAPEAGGEGGASARRRNPGGYDTCCGDCMQTTPRFDNSLDAVRASRADVRRLDGGRETARIRRDDWARAFAARLAWLGALDVDSELVRLGRSLYAHYDLLDPYHIARTVWQRRPKAGCLVLPRVARPAGIDSGAGAANATKGPTPRTHQGATTWTTTTRSAN